MLKNSRHSCWETSGSDERELHCILSIAPYQYTRSAFDIKRREYFYSFRFIQRSVLSIRLFFLNVVFRGRNNLIVWLHAMAIKYLILIIFTPFCLQVKKKRKKGDFNFKLSHKKYETVSVKLRQNRSSLEHRTVKSSSVPSARPQTVCLRAQEAAWGCRTRSGRAPPASWYLQ